MSIPDFPVTDDVILTAGFFAPQNPCRAPFPTLGRAGGGGSGGTGAVSGRAGPKRDSDGTGVDPVDGREHQSLLTVLCSSSSLSPDDHRDAPLRFSSHDTESATCLLG